MQITLKVRVYWVVVRCMEEHRLPTQRFGRYWLLEHLGSGAMSDVYAAVHLGLRKRVAIKLLKPELVAVQGAVERFLAEGETAARVQHPNVVDVTDVGLEDGQPYLVMELLRGETLEQRIAHGGPMTVASAVDVMLPVVEALQQVHHLGVLHRDVKPANIFLARTSDGRIVPKLVDFGVSVRLDGLDSHDPLGPVGTPAYMSPEQARGYRDLDERSDQYSVAATLYECVTGTEPFQGEVMEVLRAASQGPFPRACARALDIPNAFDRLLGRAGALHPEQRFASMQDLASALVVFAGPRTQRVWMPPSVRPDAVTESSFASLTPDPIEAAHTPIRFRPTSLPATRPADPASVAPTVRPGSDVGLGVATFAVAVAAMVVLLSFESRPAPVSAPAPQAPAATITSAPIAEPPTAPRPALRVTPGDAAIYLDGTLIGFGSASLPALRDGREHELLVESPGYVSRIILFRGDPPRGPLRLDPAQ